MPESVPTTAARAVFLSYASQDAEPVMKICDALRAAGVEVWFDRNELTGGDAWDQKIRGQVKTCALFMPIVSANTQSRREGYFRLEWKLADDRTHLMARGTPFLVPVCIDETKDWDAIVPDSFMSVQWTRLPGGETSPKFCARVQALLRGEVDAPAKARATSAPAPAVAAPEPKPAKKTPLWPLVVGAVLVVGVAMFFALRAKPAPASPASVPAAATPTKISTGVTAAASPVTRDWPRDPELKRAITLIDGLEATLEDFRLADEISARAVERAPSDPETVTARARVHSAFVTRNFDFSAERSTQAKRFGERAVQLSPDDPQALYALSVYLRDRAGDFARAESLARRACELAPNEPRYGRQLVRVVALLRPEEGLALGEDLVRRFPQDVLVHYELSIAYRDRREWEKFERENDAALALAPLANALNWKARAAGLLHGDFAAMRRALDQVPARVRFEERTVISAIIYAMFSGDYDYGLKALRGFAEPWFFDVANYAGPAELLQATLLAQQGKTGLARTQFELALTQLTRHQKENPTDQTARRAEISIMLGLGRRDEARALYRTALETLNRPYRIFAMAGWFGDAIPIGLLVGERDAAVQLIREAATQPEGRKTIRDRMKVDPRMAPFRDDPEIVALLAEPKKETAALSTASLSNGSTPAAIDEKSVAVLAFANLSEDKGNEYFSDGISEELINALGKVPGLKVPARTSSFFFKGKSVPVPEIAQQLGVAYVIEGSVQRAGDRVKISARLTKAADGFQVWTDSFLRDAKDVFAVEEEIAGLIAKNLSLRLGVSSAVKSEVDPEAFRLYVEGRREWNRRVPAGYSRAEQLLTRAIQLAPKFTQAHAALSDVWELQGEWDNELGPYDQRDGVLARRVHAKVREALALDPECAEAQASLGLIEWNSWRFADGEEALRSAVRINPSYASAHQWLGRILMFQGRLDEALAALKRAAELDPLSPRILDNYAWALLHAGKWDEALSLLDRALALQTDSVQANSIKARIFAQQGRSDEAIKLVTALPPGVWISSHWRAMALSLIGDAPARSALEALLTDRNAVTRFTAMLGLGRQEDALRTFDPGKVESTRADVLLFDPFYDRVRADVRFTKALAAIGLTEAHARAQAWRKAHPPEKPAK